MYAPTPDNLAAILDRFPTYTSRRHDVVAMSKYLSNRPSTWDGVSVGDVLTTSGMFRI